VPAVCPVVLPDGLTQLATGGNDYAVLLWIDQTTSSGRHRQVLIEI
jgi:hypothetical protein